MRHMLYRPFDGIWFLFPYWTNLVILVLLEIINLVFFRIQIWLVLVLYLIKITFICLI